VTRPLPPLPATSARIAVAGSDPARAAEAEALARELGVPLSGDGGNAELLLVVTAERLELRDAGDPRVGPVYADFGRLDLRPHGPSLSRRQPLARAFGKKVRTIVDATAGLAQDALLLALLGFRVTAIERSPVAAVLARDGLRRFGAARGVALDARLELLGGDARTLLATLPAPDAVYLDPMFPPKRRKSAAVRKEMRLLRALVGDDADAAELLALARTRARERVVVKRPDDAAPLAPDPHASIAGKLVRYDVYLAPR
jgi:16S rRNA (guanine1516-N2)-methyltransferase